MIMFQCVWPTRTKHRRRSSSQLAINSAIRSPKGRSPRSHSAPPRDEARTTAGTSPLIQSTTCCGLHLLTASISPKVVWLSLQDERDEPLPGHDELTQRQTGGPRRDARTEPRTPARRSLTDWLHARPRRRFRAEPREGRVSGYRCFGHAPLFL